MSPFSESSVLEHGEESFEMPFGFIIDADNAKKKDIQKALENNQSRAFLVTEDGDIIIGSTQFHQDIMVGRHEAFKVLDKGTIVPKSKLINFIYRDCCLMLKLVKR